MLVFDRAFFGISPIGGKDPDPNPLPYSCTRDKMSLGSKGDVRSAEGEARGMRAQRPVLVFVTVLVATLMGTGVASAAPPQTIYRDLADNGRLDGHYTRADIARAFNLDRVVRTDRRPARVRPAPTVHRVVAGKSERRVPFTGLDVALLTIGGGPLLLIGMLLRRRVAPTAEPGVAGG